MSQLSGMMSSLMVLIFMVVVMEVSSHSYLTNPRPRSDQSGGCRVGHPTNLPQYDVNCPGPCENIGRIDNSIAATYQRGQTVQVRWSKNNHQQGFVRWTIVKKEDMMNKQKHADMTFSYTCWDANRVPCQGNFECGTDEQKIAFTEQLQIPAIYPDGEYILGWAWFGAAGDLSDYHSCSNIRIAGGPMAAQYTPITKRCASKTETVGDCPREPCNKGNPVSRLPKKFANGNPPPLLASAFGGATTTNTNTNTNTNNNPPAQPPATSSNSEGIQSGSVYRVKPSNANSRCLDASGTNNGAFVQIYGCWAGENQKWKVERQNDGSYKFINQGQSNYPKALDIATNSNVAQVWDSWTGDNQKFNVHKVGNNLYTIQCVHSKLMLSLVNHGNGDGARVEQRAYTGAADQKWHFEKL